MKNYFFEKRGKLPVSGEFDVLVAGAGVAGVAAAAAAARAGADVCLVEKGVSPGGLATRGLIAIYLPLCDGGGNKVIGGIPEELLKLSLKYGPGRIPGCWRRKAPKTQRIQERYRVSFNPASFALSLSEFLLENRVSVLYDTLVASCLADGAGIKAAVIENKSGRSALSAKVFVDATGDADLCRAAGERTVSLDTNTKAGWYLLYDKGELVLRKLKGEGAREEYFSGTDSGDVSRFCAEMMKMVLLDLKRKTTGFSDIFPAALPSTPQFRMTRRLKGMYELDESEERKFFDDAVCMTGDWRKPGKVFFIPYRCLFGRAKNLFAAGRCISVTESMWQITRAIPACAATGEAAGSAAALCAGSGIPADALDPGLLRKKLVENGVIIDPAFSEK